jgi:hypothetical protein
MRFLCLHRPTQGFTKRANVSLCGAPSRSIIVDPASYMSDPATPTDILSQIFELVVAHRPASLYTIRSVTRNCFETAAITPGLWSNFTLSHKIHFKDVEYVRVHLQNAGGPPLDISISLHEELQDADIPAIPLLRQRQVLEVAHPGHAVSGGLAEDYRWDWRGSVCPYP